MEGKDWDLDVMVFMYLILIGFRSSRGRRMNGQYGVMLEVMIYMESDKGELAHAYF